MATKRVTQNDKILEFMQIHGAITQGDAYRLGCTRLAARIADLKSRGYAIQVESVQVRKSDGTKTRVAKYSLADGKKEGA